MFILELLKWKSIIVGLFWVLIWQLSFAIGYNKPFWQETEGSYIVQYLNDERNRCKDEDNYFFSDRRNVYRYSFKDGTQTVCVSVEGTEKRIEDFAVWKDDIYYVTSLLNEEKEYIWEMSRINYQSKEQEVLLAYEDFVHLNGEEKLDYVGIDVHKGYLFFYINADNEYICPIGEDVSKNSVELKNLFEAEGTPGDKQRVEYDGIIIEYETTSQDKCDITGIWDEQGYKILFSNVDRCLKVGDKWVSFRKENRADRIQYTTEYDYTWKDITIFNRGEYKNSYIDDEHLVEEEGRVIGLISVSEHWAWYSDLAQEYLKKDVLFELDIETGESRKLFDTRINRTKIIGYKDGELYYIKNEKVYAENLESKEKTVLGNIPKGKDYIIDWQGGYLIIREDFTYGQNGDIVLVYKVEQEAPVHQESYTEVSQEEIEKNLLESVPEISDYATYIEKESDGGARLYIQIYEKEEVTVDDLMTTINCYPVYVGEKWDTHTANWDWFYVSENLDAVYWYDVVDGEIYSLEEWRNGDGYRAEILKAEEIFEKYAELLEEVNPKRMAFIYFDEDDIPELVFINNGKYRLFSYDGTMVNEIVMPNAEIRANVYGMRHDVEDAEKPVLYWFEYVPYQGLMRVHTGNEDGRNDYYLRYANGELSIELKASSNDYEWNTFDAGNEIGNDEFREKLSGLGYDKLIPCGYFYEDAKTAYENIGKVSDTKQIWNEFVTGKRDAVEYVEVIGDIPEEGFITRSFDEIYKDITCEEDWWGKEEYIDFDNDRQDELVLHGYAGSRMLFDVIGETVYVLLQTGSTTDNASVSQMHEENVIVRTDLLHAGRELYRIKQYDACGCLVDYYTFSASYEGENYTENDSFKYNDRMISMEEYNALVDSIQEYVNETKAEVENEPRQEEPSHNLKDIDWETFQAQLSDEDAETLQKYLPVLTGGEFTWIKHYSDPDNADAYLHKLRQAVIQDIHLDCDQPDTHVSTIAFADVFQSGTQDIILYLYNMGGHYLILHEENSIIYGINYPVRWFQGLQEDGLYCSSGGAGYQRFYRMTFENGDYTEHLICIRDEGEFYIDDKKQGTTHEEAWKLFDAWFDTYMQNDVKWHSPF